MKIDRSRHVLASVRLFDGTDTPRHLRFLPTPHCKGGAATDARRAVRPRFHDRQGPGPDHPTPPAARLRRGAGVDRGRRVRGPGVGRRPEGAAGLGCAAGRRRQAAGGRAPRLAHRPGLPLGPPCRPDPGAAEGLAHRAPLLHQEPWLDTTNAFGEVLFHITVGYAQLERSIIAERVRAGMDRARRQGRTLGRPRAEERPEVRRRWPEVQAALAAGTLSRRAEARRLGLGTATVRRMLDEGCAEKGAAERAREPVF
ncbi:MAG: recombinase family protein [Nitrospiraceae bacterium]|nr:recombinase family protein [Nitrospiraceae bacterium]